MRPHEFLGIFSYLSTAIATFGGIYARELFWRYSWLCMPSWLFLHIKFSISWFFYKCDQRTDRRTDTHPFRDARTHLRSLPLISVFSSFHRPRTDSSKQIPANFQLLCFNCFVHLQWWAVFFLLIIDCIGCSDFILCSIKNFDKPFYTYS